jgi:hypothetical protein
MSRRSSFGRLPLAVQSQLLVAAFAVSSLWVVQEGLRTTDRAHALATVQAIAEDVASMRSGHAPAPVEAYNQAGPLPATSARVLGAPMGAAVRVLRGHQVLQEAGPRRAPAPTAFERLALEAFQADPARMEVHEVMGDRLLYLRRLPASAPVGNDTPGGPHAVSVIWPIAGSSADLAWRVLGWPQWVVAAGWVAVLGSLLLWLRRRVLAPTLSLVLYARHLVEAQPGQTVHKPVLDEDEIRSANELHRLSAAMKALQRALGLAQQHRA